MSQDQYSAVGRLLTAHLLLAMAPLGTGLLAIDSRTLPLAWSIAAVPLAQVMLLGIWLGMCESGSMFRRVVTGLVAAGYLSIWSAIGQVLFSPALTIEAAVQAYNQNFAVFFVLLTALSLMMAGLGRLVGNITFMKTNEPVAEPRFRYSLLMLLMLSTAIAVVLGLVRLARADLGPGIAEARLAEYALGVVVFALNTLATIWAALGPGHVKRRLGIVFLVSLALGLFFATGAGHSVDIEPWWMIIGAALVVLVPTTLVALSLLYLRRAGYRLIPARAGS